MASEARLQLVPRIHEDKIGEIDAPLNGGDGGGTYDDMERRVTKLEDKVDKLIDRATAVEVSIATLSERIAHLPSKDFIVKVVVGSLSAFGALSLFSTQIKAALGIH